MYLLCFILAQAPRDDADRSEMTCTLASTFMLSISVCNHLRAHSPNILCIHVALCSKLADITGGGFLLAGLG